MPEFPEFKWYEKRPEANYPTREIADYRQVFGPTIFVTRAPWYAIWWFNIQRWAGIIAIRRWAGNPDVWDEKSFPNNES